MPDTIIPIQASSTGSQLRPARVTLVIDRSASMSKLIDDVIRGIESIRNQLQDHDMVKF